MTWDLLHINLAFTALLFIVVLWQTVKIYALDRVRKHFYSSGLKKNLEEILIEQGQGIVQINQNIEDLNLQTENLRTINQNNFQKIGLVRFSQHGEAGNLSFSLVLLDAHDNGLAISSLHGRDGCRIYSKDIKHGKSNIKLTEEEKDALNQAVQITPA